MNLKSLLLSIIFFIGINFYIHPLETLLLEESKNSYSIGRYFKYYEDKTNKMTIDEIRKPEISDKFIKNKKDYLNIGHTKSSIWVKFKIKNNSTTNNLYFIEETFPFKDYIEFYDFDDKGNYTIQKSGLDIPFNKRNIKNKKYIFLINIGTSLEKEYFLKLQSKRTMHLLLNIYKEKYFYNKDNNDNFALGLYYGIMLIILIINIVVYLFVREKSFLYFIFFFLCVVIIEMYFNLVIQELLPDSVWYNKFSFYPFGFLCLFFSALFINDFFNTKSNFPVFHIIILLLKIIFLINFVLSFFVNTIILLYVCVISLIISLGLAIYLGIISLIKKQRSSLYFLIAWGLYFTGTALTGFGGIGLIPLNITVLNTMQISSIFLVVFLPIALLDKYIVLKKEKEFAEKSVAEKEREKFTSIGMLLGNISHEIYNPLSGISGPLDNLKKSFNQDQIDKPKINKHLDYIEKNVSRIDRIIRNVRALYKKEVLEKEKIDLREITQSVLDNYKENSKKNIEFKFDINKEIEIYGDKNALYQILNNLVSNAVESIKEKGKIIISLEKNKNEKFIKVEDTGIGIDNEEIEKIFNAFYTTKTVSNNIGLGLYIVKDLIIKSGWDIKVSSIKDKGTTFTIIIKE